MDVARGGSRIRSHYRLLSATMATIVTGTAPQASADSHPAPGALPLAVLGFVAGFGSSFLGIGGGLIIVPVLLVAFHIPIKTAVGSSLAAIVPISIVGALTEAIGGWGNIHWKMGAVLTVGSLAGSWLGGRILPIVRDRPLRLLYTVFLILTAWRMFASSASAAGEAGGHLSVAGAPLLAGAIGLGAGVLGGIASVFFGIGGGVIMVPALSLFFAEFPFHAARATSLVTIIPTSAFGAWQHRRMGTLNAAIARGLVPAGLVGAVLGVLIVNRVPARPCRIAFAALLMLAALRLMALRPAKA